MKNNYNYSSMSKLYIQAQATFPETLRVNSRQLNREIFTNHSIKDADIMLLVRVIDNGLGSSYKRVSGRYWRTDKINEMKKDADEMIFVVYKDKAGEVVSFISFAVVEENSQLVIYLYEIHTVSKHQGRQLGKKLMGWYHDCQQALQLNSQLTVFSDNHRAKDWYLGWQYKIIDQWPQASPNCYILEKKYTTA